MTDQSLPTGQQDQAALSPMISFKHYVWRGIFKKGLLATGGQGQPQFTVIPPKPPVSASPRVSVLKTVVLPDRARPTIATCTGAG